MSETEKHYDPFEGGEPIEDDAPSAESLDTGALEDTSDEGIEIEAAQPEPEPETKTIETEAAAEEPQPKTIEPEPEPEPEPDAGEVIPKWRLDREIRRRKALELQMQNRPTPSKADDSSTEEEPEWNVGERAKAMFDLVLDGDTEKSVEAFNDIIKDVVERTARRATRDVDNRVEQVTRQTQAKQSVQQVISRLKDTYEPLDDSSEKFDPELTQRTLTYQRAYIDEGLTPADALEQAAEDAMRLMRPELLTPKQAAAAPKTRNLQKQVAAARQQPPRAQGSVSEQTSVPDIFKLSDEDFMKLSAKELAKLRGDFG